MPGREQAALVFDHATQDLVERQRRLYPTSF
jgi:hypothetical protein